MAANDDLVHRYESNDDYYCILFEDRFDRVVSDFESIFGRATSNSNPFGS